MSMRRGLTKRYHNLVLLVMLMPAGVAWAQSSRPGMGSTPYDGGVTFRVWAPDAASVFVEGDFNGWSTTATPLGAEGNGNWSNDVPGAVVGQTYRYVISSPGFPTVNRRDPYSRVETEANYTAGNSIIYDTSAYQWQSGPFTAPPLKNLMIYEMEIGTYASVKGQLTGTFQSAIGRLPEVIGLGFNAVEVLPVIENPPENIGYQPTDQLSVDNEEYGGPDNFKAFVDACHAAGLAVILDIVHNHWGPWDLTTNQYDGWHTTEYPGGIYFYDSADWNSPFGPRPNYSDANVAQYIADSLTMWIDEYRIDGFRWDSVSNIYDTDNGTGTYLPDGWTLLQNSNVQTVTDNPAFVNIAEDLTGNALVTAPIVQAGAGFASQWNGNFVSNMRIQLTQSSDSAVDMEAVASAIGQAFNGVFTQNLNYDESHNEVSDGGQRLTTLIDPADPTGWLALKKSTLGAAILLTSPGVPMIYQGQEFVENEPLVWNEPLQWSLATEFASIRKLWGALATARKNASGHTANLAGDGLNIYQVDDVNKLIAYERFDSQAAGKTVVIANFTGNAEQNMKVGFPARGNWWTRINSDSTAYSSTFSGAGSSVVQATGGAYSGMPYSGTVTVGPYSLLILSQQ
jgi:1,4-alpha-glucan branching enzyme